MGGQEIIDGVKYKELDNFYPCVFSYNGNTFSSSEQYFQYHKASWDSNERDEYRNTIIRTHDPMKAWEMGQKVALRSDWEDIKLDVMFEANFLKFFQNPYLQEILERTNEILTRNFEIVCTGSTEFWNYNNSIILKKVRLAIFDVRGVMREKFR